MGIAAVVALVAAVVFVDQGYMAMGCVLQVVGFMAAWMQGKSNR